jgi:proliferating cell nuclear antigen
MKRIGVAVMQIEFDRKSILLYFDSINSITGEGFLHIKTDGLLLSSVDTANVAFISARYKYKFDNEIDMAVDCQKLKSTIGALTSKNVTIDFDKSIHIKGGKVERTILLLNKSTLKKEIELPIMDFPVCVEVLSSDFINIVEAIDKMGVVEGSLPLKLCFDYNKNKFIIHCVNDLSEPTRLEFDTISTESGEGTVHKSYFSFDYILDMAKMIKKIGSDHIKIYLGTDAPLKIEIETDVVSITWLLAPRVDVEV